MLRGVLNKCQYYCMVAPFGLLWNSRTKSLMGTTQEWCVLLWAISVSITPLYGHLLLISQTIQVRQTWHAGNWWRRRDKHISNIILWASTYGHISIGRTAKAYIHQPCADTVCRLEELPRAMTDKDGQRERVKHIYAISIYRIEVKLTWTYFILKNFDK